MCPDLWSYEQRTLVATVVYPQLTARRDEDDRKFCKAPTSPLVK